MIGRRENRSEMVNSELESERQLVLDNRKLILAFVLLVALCGCSFVVGYMEGSRQGKQKGIQTVDSLEAPRASGPPEAIAPESESETLNWYKHVNKKEGEPEIIPPEATAPSTPADAAALPPSPPVNAEAAEMEPPRDRTGYSVQVGAFRQRREAEAKARMLRGKGFESRIEAPGSPEELYRLKVGSFKSRADAIAVQRQLEKSGFRSFVKSN